MDGFDLARHSFPEVGTRRTWTFRNSLALGHSEISSAQKTPCSQVASDVPIWVLLPFARARFLGARF